MIGDQNLVDDHLLNDLIVEDFIHEIKSMDHIPTLEKIIDVLKINYILETF